jgi:AraC family transcriptional regulator, regulatory protein of adaptative response / DNA-3-methyladenine glycosylase II
MQPPTFSPEDKPYFNVTLPENYLVAYTLRTWGRDANSPTEQVHGNRMTKALCLGSTPTLLHVELEPATAHCYIEARHPIGPEKVAEAQTIVVRLLGLDNDPEAFERQLAEQGLSHLVEGRRGLRIPLTTTLFEGLTWAIVGQQVNLAFAFTLCRALIELCGVPVADGYRAHPTPEAVANLDYTNLTARQFSRRKAEYLIDLARQIVSGTLPLDELASAPATEVEQRLLAVRGLGPWSVNYAMMRAFGFHDCVPLGDTGLTSALQRFFNLDVRPDAPTTLALMQPFAPFRSLATYHLWMTLGDPV